MVETIEQCSDARDSIVEERAIFLETSSRSYALRELTFLHLRLVWRDVSQLCWRHCSSSERGDRAIYNLYTNYAMFKQADAFCQQGISQSDGATAFPLHDLSFRLAPRS